jgi:hypothetical protein
LLLEVRTLKLLNGLDTEFVAVVEEELTESVATE